MSAASSSTTLKIYFSLPSDKQEIRRFTTASPLVLAALDAFLTATYERHFTPPLRFVLQFDDGEDLCTVSSEAELQDALALHAASGQGGCLKLLGAFDTQPLQQSLPPSASGLSSPGAPAAMADLPSVLPSNVVVREPSPDVDVEIVHSQSAAIETPEGADSDYERIDDEKPASPKVVPAPASSAKTSPPVQAGELSPARVMATPVVEDPVPSASPVEIVDVTNASAAAPTPKSQSSAAAAASTDNSSPAIHFGFRCDSCGVRPLVGTRFNCMTCGPADGGYDLCARCEAAGTHGHSKQHEFAVHVAPVEAANVAVSPESAAAPAAAAEGPMIHEGVTCDGCGQSPLTGVRFCCIECRRLVPGGFDLCAGCEQRGFSNADHDAATHTMLKIRVPHQGGRGPWGRHGGRPGSPHRGPHGHHGHHGPHGHGPFGRGPGPHGPCGGPRGLPDFLGAPLGPMGFFSGFGPRNGRGGHGGHGGCHRGEGWGRHHHKRDDPNRPRAEFVSDVTLADGLEVQAGETLRKVWSVKNIGNAPWPAGTKLVFVGGDLAPESDGRAEDSHGAVVPHAGPGDVVHVAMDIVVPKEAGRFRATFRLQTPDGDRFGPRVWIDVRVPAAEAEAPKPEAQPAPQPITVPVVVAASAPAAVAAAAVPAPASSPVALPVAVPVVKAPIRSLAPLPAEAPKPVAAAVPSVPAQAKAVDEAALAAEFRAARLSPQAGVGATPSAATGAASPSAVDPVNGVRPAFQYANELVYLRSMGFVDNALNKYLLLNNKGDLQQVVQWLLANAK